MVQSAQHETAVAISDAEMSAIAYVEAAEGDVARALLWALEDLIDCEGRLVLAQRSVSQGFVRAALRAIAKTGR
ncbi:hypothetical protein [uncultured Methylobacterium sp.]|uniref:hypothetical protein n=1 Tax=uncultured Methylobacterium sp. TaxID=157278 RepID=UPI0035CA8DCE